MSTHTRAPPGHLPPAFCPPCSPTAPEHLLAAQARPSVEANLWRDGRHTPDAPADLSTAVGIQDGAKGTNGIDFAVAVNGEVLQPTLVEGPGGWQPIAVDLAAWAGQTVVLSLVADARDDAVCDWARWAEPVIRAK